MKRPVWSWIVAALAALAGSPGPGALDAAQRPAPEQPVFRSGVDLISIDLTVVDRDGRRVADLVADDFEVLIDGKPRDVVSAAFVGATGASEAARAPDRTEEPAPALPVSPGQPNLIVLAVEVAGTSGDRRTEILAAANSVLDRLPPEDRVAVVRSPHRGEAIEFTTDRDLARERLKEIGGWSRRLGRHLPFSIVDLGTPELGAIIAERCGTDNLCAATLQSEATALRLESEARAAEAVMGLERLLDALRLVEGPKTMLLFAAEMPLHDSRVDGDRLSRAAGAARTRVHVLYSQNVITDAGDTYVRTRGLAEQRREVEGLEFVADQTGGGIFRLSGPSRQVADRIAAEVSSQYLILVDTAPEDGDGRIHRVEVSVPGRSVMVRARRQFRADTVYTMRATRSAAPPAPSPGALEASRPTSPSRDGAERAEVPAGSVGTVFVTTDHLHSERQSPETASVVREVGAALARQGFAVADAEETGTIRVAISGQRLQRSPNRAQSRVLVKATISAGDAITEIRGRSQWTDSLALAADDAARLIEAWSRELPENHDTKVLAPPAPADPADPQTLLPRMRAYVAEYEQRLAGLVAEELYTQVYSHRTAPYPAPASVTRRVLKSDMGFAWFPSPGTWFGFRDVIEVDGEAVPDRQERLEDLFVRRNFPSAEQLTRVTAASARFNIGPVRRSLNVPTVALIVASPVNVGRCSFELRGFDAIDGVRVARVAFTETSSPTFITREGRDWPSRGLLWIDPATGRIHRTDFRLAGRELDVRLTTWFRFDEDLDLMVPHRMREVYDDPSRDDDYIQAVAEYSNFRTFRVETSNQPRPPGD